MSLAFRNSDVTLSQNESKGSPGGSKLLPVGPLSGDYLPEDDPKGVDIRLLAAFTTVDELWGCPLEGALEARHHGGLIDQDLGQTHILHVQDIPSGLSCHLLPLISSRDPFRGVLEAGQHG